MIENTAVELGQPVRVAVYEPALALDAQQPQFLIAVETSFPVLLGRLLDYLLDCVCGVFAARSQDGLLGLQYFSSNFFLFLIVIFSE